jgi:hypothetical protein
MHFFKPAILCSLMLLAPAALAGHPQQRGYGYSQHEWARYYADTTIRQVHQNRRLYCNYHGQRWSPSYQQHFRWALRVSRGSAQSEINHRRRDLDHCLAQRGHYPGRYDWRGYGSRGYDWHHDRYRIPHRHGTPGHPGHRFDHHRRDNEHDAGHGRGRDGRRHDGR